MGTREDSDVTVVAKCVQWFLVPTHIQCITNSQSILIIKKINRLISKN